MGAMLAKKPVAVACSPRDRAHSKGINARAAFVAMAVASCCLEALRAAFIVARTPLTPLSPEHHAKTVPSAAARPLCERGAPA